MKSEEFEQVFLIDWAVKYPEIHPYLIELRPQENKGNELKKDTRMGAKRGTPRLFFACPTKDFSGFWIELKPRNCRPNRDQSFFLEKMKSKGYQTGIFYSWMDAAKAIQDYLNIKRTFH